MSDETKDRVAWAVWIVLMWCYFSFTIDTVITSVL